MPIFLTLMLVAMSFPAPLPASDQTPERVLIAGCDQAYPPYEFIDLRGEPAGFTIDLIRAISEVMGLAIDIRPGPWAAVRDDLEEGRIDLITGMYFSEQRDRLVDFSPPHLIVSSSIFVRRGSTIRQAADLASREIIVQEGDILHDYARTAFPQARIITVPSPLEALRLLASGRHDCALCTRLQGLYFVSTWKLSNIEAVGAPLEHRPYCFAVHEGDEDLLAALSEGLRIIKATGRYAQIYDTWFGAYERQAPPLLIRHILWVLIPLLLVLTGIFLWSWSLRKTVALRTEDLKSELTRRARAEEDLRLNESRLEALLRIGQMTQATPRKITDLVLEECVRLTRSTLGYIAFVSEDEFVITMHSWSEKAMQECRVSDRPQTYRLEDTGLWTEALRQRRSVITNDYQAPNPLKRGCPEGHVQITRHMGIPVFDGERIVALAGVANKAEDYDASDERQLTLLMQEMWRILERDASELRLKESQRTLSEILEQSSIATFVLDRDHRVLYWNRACERLTGLSAAAVVGTRDHWRPFYPEARPLLADLILDGASPGEVERLYRGSSVTHRTSEEAHEAENFYPSLGRWLFFSSAPLRDTAGQVVGAIESFQDITERKVAEEAHRESERRLATLMGNLPGMAFRCRNDSDWSMEFVSQGALPLTGYAPGDLIDNRTVAYGDLIHPADRDTVWNEIQQALSGQRPYTLTYRIRTAKGQERWVWEQGIGVGGTEGAPVAIEGFISDITELKMAEAALRISKERLEISNRELQDFAYVSSHDLQEPLRKVQAFGERFMTHYRDRLDERGIDYLERMLGATGRMQQLINDLLSFSRITTKARPFAQVDLARVIREVLDDLEVTIEALGATVTLDDLPMLEAEPLQMRQLFQNLIGNALKFHRPEDTPCVEISASPAPPGEDGSARCEIRVRDNGIGFDVKYLDRIFGVFQRLHGRGEYQGTGIGLAVCRKIAERHGGTITAHSSPGQGATFIITLPLTQEKGAIL